MHDLIGRLHILVLHMPIGILLLGVIFEWLHYLNWVRLGRHIRSLTFAMGSLAAFVACITGYILSGSGEYDIAMVQDHQWAGIFTSAIAFIAWMIIYFEKDKSAPWLALLVVGGISYTGHLGGSMTHGADYLFSQDETSSSDGHPTFLVQNAQNAYLYADIIHPIFEAKCNGCHSASKMKGKLRMDSYEFIVKGGKSREDLLGASENSGILNRINLPIHKDEHMPPEEKHQLSSDEKSIIKTWIDNGAKKDFRIDVTHENDALIALANRVILADPDDNQRAQESTISADLPDVEVDPISDAQLESLRQLNIVALPAGEGSPFIELNLINLSAITAAHWDAMLDIASNIVRLKLSDLPISDADISQVPQMIHLMKLHLDNTRITDACMSDINKLSHLSYLNISNTAVTDGGLVKLNNLTKLKTIYAYQLDGELDSLPSGIKIERGGYQLEFYKEDTIKVLEI